MCAYCHEVGCQTCMASNNFVDCMCSCERRASESTLRTHSATTHHHALTPSLPFFATYFRLWRSPFTVKSIFCVWILLHSSQPMEDSRTLRSLPTATNVFSIFCGSSSLAAGVSERRADLCRDGERLCVGLRVRLRLRLGLRRRRFSGGSCRGLLRGCDERGL